MKKSPCVVVWGVMLFSVFSAELVACSEADSPRSEGGAWRWPSNCTPVMVVAPVRAVEFVDCFAASAASATGSPPWTS